MERFPKEFKRNFLQNLDKRFLIILLLSFIVNIATVIYLERLIPKQLSSKTIAKIQRQYANLLLDRKFDSGTALKPSAKSIYDFQGDLITGIDKWVESLTFDIFESLDNLETPDLPLGDMKLKEPAGLTREDIEQLRNASAQRRITASSERESEMGNVGILGVISGSNKSIDQEYIQDLLEYANENSEHLVQVLSKLSRIRVPHSGAQLNLKKVQGISSGEKFASVRGERATVNNEVKKLIRDMEPVREAETETVTRNLQYEEINSSYLNQPVKSERAGLTRKSRDVVRIVRSHMKALEDCYKQGLKMDPDLKGKILIRFSINPDGEVIYASAISSTLNNSQVENCILSKIRRWRDFPPCDPAFGNKTYRQSFKFGI